jgi:glycosyltransferase involved in cell wall biosynthesis
MINRLFMDKLSRALKRLAHSIIDYRREKRQHPPRIRVVPADGDRSTTVYYLCPDTNKPSGGVRTIYQHVDILNSMGIEAFVLHHRRGFFCKWFEHQTKVLAASEVTLISTDILVIPELYVSYAKELRVGRLIIFNQGAYQSFKGRQSVSGWRSCVEGGKLEAILAVSLDNEDYIRYTFPTVRTERVRNSIDSRVFYPSEGLPDRRIAVMPRRRGKELCTHVLGLLTLRGALNGWEVINIDNCSQEETAELLRTSAIFLSFSEREGFGLPPAEAMACGCYVVGFTGLGGREFFYPGLCMQVEEGNVLALAKAAEEAMRNFDSDPSSVRELALKASSIIRDEYSIQKQIRDLRDVFESVDLDPRREKLSNP